MYLKMKKIIITKNNEPVYPKEDPEYRKRIMDKFYQQVKNTNWKEIDNGIKEKSKKGRKSKPIIKPKAVKEQHPKLKPKINKFFKFE